MTGTIEAVTPSLNAYLAWHWAKRGREVKRWQMLVLAAFGWGKYEKKRMRLTVRQWRRRRIDSTNFVGGLKPLEDALVRMGHLYDDSLAWVEQGPHEQLRAGKGTPRTEITLEEVG